MFPKVLMESNLKMYYNDIYLQRLNLPGLDEFLRLLAFCDEPCQDGTFLMIEYETQYYILLETYEHT